MNALLSVEQSHQRFLGLRTTGDRVAGGQSVGFRSCAALPAAARIAALLSALRQKSYGF